MFPAMRLPNSIAIALDTPAPARAKALARALAPHVGCFKVGMEFFYAHGRAGYAAIAEVGLPIFLDLKLHDIPNTVASALEALMRLDPPPAIVNVHALGGVAMMKAAAEAVAGRTQLVAVTLLTSLAAGDLAALGFAPDQDIASHTLALALLSKQAGLAGVVCSAHDIVAIKRACGREFLTVVPGLRPRGAAPGDQKRFATPG
ncbi:MAG: orotidine-5'-phosphate decarboxylase, partial [Pseudomonadota bacterium]|nr:orotidine-5'-phosphate decarboxylase [Pseudomonadota bacterium]